MMMMMMMMMIKGRHVWAGHLLDAARSAAALRHTCLSTASARL